MSTVNIADAMENLDELIDRVLKNETITITRDGKDIAQLTPIDKARRAAQPHSAKK
jgi:prevent-host-death family protein